MAPKYVARQIWEWWNPDSQSWEPWFRENFTQERIDEFILGGGHNLLITREEYLSVPANQRMKHLLEILTALGQPLAVAQREADVATKQ